MEKIRGLLKPKQAVKVAVIFLLLTVLEIVICWGCSFFVFLILIPVDFLVSSIAVIYEKEILSFLSSAVKKPWFLRACISILFGLLMFHLLTAFWNRQWFISDEAEIFMHGQAIANGQLLYKDTASQHTPIMYYISAVFTLLGATTITGYRLCFYGVIAALWALMYFRYSESRGKIAIVLYPILYVCLIAQLHYPTACILSDQFQGLGMVILLYEFLDFNEKRDLSISSCVMISLAVLISFGAAFVSVFAICVMCITVISIDIWGQVKKKSTLKLAWSELWRRYAKLASIVLAPILLICVFYAITGSLDDCIAWTYTINRTVYSKYLLGEYGTSIIEGFFGGRVRFIELFRINGVTTLLLSQLFVVVLALSYIIYTARKGNGPAIRIVGLMLFVIASATRGLFDFHGLPAIALLCAMSACFIGESLIVAIKKKALPTAIFSLCLVIFVTPYLRDAYPNTRTVTCENDIPVGSPSWYIDKITEDGERVGFATLDCHVMVQGEVVPATVQAGSVPWFWDFAKEEAMAELNSDPPRVFLFSVHHDVWGYKITDYAPELVEFIYTNYTCLSYIDQPTIWVHNSYIDEVNENIRNGSYFANEIDK